MGFSYLSPYRFDKGVSYINVATALLTYNLTSTETLPSWLSLSRMSTATRFDSTGTLVDSAVDTARWDYGYDGTNWVNQGLLLEKQSTNILTRSYNVSANITSAGGKVDAAGQTNTDSILFTAKVGTGDCYFCPSGISNTNVSNKLCHSIFINNSSVSYNIILRKLASIRPGTNSLKNVNGKLVKATSNISDLVLQDLNTWTRTKYNFDAGSTACYARYNVSDSTDPLATSTVAATTTVCFPQAEYANYVSSYVRTSTAQATRSQDNLQLNLLNYTGSIKLTYKRQDTEVVETKWIDLTNSSNPNLSDYLDVRSLVIRN